MIGFLKQDTKMRQYTEIQSFKTTKFQKHCFEVLEIVYHINPSAFIRIAIEEKLRKDIPELREKKYKYHLNENK
jgi:hypothetical protein